MARNAHLPKFGSHPPNAQRRAIRRVESERCCWPDCDSPGWTDAELPLCPRHAARVHIRVADMVPEASKRAAKADRQELWYSREGYVYIAKVGKLVKIGFSKDPPVRMKAFGGKLLAYRPGTLDTERDLHAEFHEHQSHGEYFTPAPEIVARIREWRLDLAAASSAESES